MYEAAALGANMSVPYGSWMGATIEDSFYAPHGLATEIQTFVADHEHLIARPTVNEVAVVFSVESTRELIGKADASDNTTNARDESVVVPYRVVTTHACRRGRAVRRRDLSRRRDRAGPCVGRDAGALLHRGAAGRATR